VRVAGSGGTGKDSFGRDSLNVCEDVGIFGNEDSGEISFLDSLKVCATVEILGNGGSGFERRSTFELGFL
jgi:hypothetical protein